VKVRLGLAAAAAAALVFVAAGGAARTTAPGGIVDIYTNLGYQGAEAAGTGIVLSSSGVVLTNNHVIRGATSIKVTIVDSGRSYTAKVLGYALDQDVAVIQLKNASGLQTAPLGHSTGLHVRDTVTAYGNAGGVGGAPSSATGAIVGLGKSITARDDSGTAEKLTGLIETDAALRPGDSGGPMVDAGGSVIGMDTAAGSSFTFESGSVDRGYAIPIDKATQIAAKIVAGRGSAAIHIGATAFMGVSVQDQNDAFYGRSSNGVTVVQVVPSSPVAKIGIGPGDILTRFDGKAVSTSNRLTSLVATKHPGESVQVRWVDQFGQAHVATITLATGPPQ
jgi:S1-C subfamily serine protease